AVDDVDTRARELLARVLVLFLAAAARRVEHHADVHTAALGGDDGADQGRIGEDEHLDAERFPRLADRVEDRRSGIIRQDDQRTRRHRYSWAWRALGGRNATK